MGDVTAKGGIGNQAPQYFGLTSTNSDKTEPFHGAARKLCPPLPSTQVARRGGAGRV